MDKLDNKVADIDRIDDQLTALLNQRFQAVANLPEKDLPLHDPAFLQKTVSRLTAANSGPVTAETINAIYREIFSGIRQLLKPARAAFLGPMGTFSHQAVMEIFGTGTALVPQKTIPEVFRAIECDRADYGCVPIENSAEGVINYTMDWLVKSDVKIYAEKY